jgi:glutathione peroxidase
MTPTINSMRGLCSFAVVPVALLLLSSVDSTSVAADKAAKKEKNVSGPLGYTVKSIDGKDVDLSQYKGKVVMVVNVASKCGNTPQYKDLEALYQRYKADGFVVLGFPANEFGSQEPGSNAEIAEFCTQKYGVTFPMFEKIVVKGKGQAPLYHHLTSKQTDPKFAGPIKWNFEKFLINRQGEVINRFDPGLNPSKEMVVKDIEKALAEK